MIERLVIECAGVSCSSTVKRGEDNAHIKMTLLDVRAHELMQSLIKEAGVEVILDHLKDDDIKKYLKGAK